MRAPVLLIACELDSIGEAVVRALDGRLEHEAHVVVDGAAAVAAALTPPRPDLLVVDPALGVDARGGDTGRGVVAAVRADDLAYDLPIIGLVPCDDGALVPLPDLDAVVPLDAIDELLVITIEDVLDRVHRIRLNRRWERLGDLLEQRGG